MNSLLSIVLVAALSATAPAQTVLKTWSGFSGSKFGSAVSTFRDFNSDGFQDVLIGAPGATASHGYGVVYVVSGQALLQQNNYTILATLLGDSTSDQFGATIETVGDVTGDGKTDFVVGATLNDTSANNAGRVFLYDGSSLVRLTGWSGTGAQSQLGWSMTHLGDWDQDGHQELAVGAPFDDTGGVDRGVIKVLEITPTAGSYVFSNVASFHGAADFDLRGYVLDSADFGVIGGFANRRELISGQPLTPSPLGGVNNGAVFVYAYQGNWSSLDLVIRKYGESSDEYGFSLDASADITGDGTRDLVVGAPFHDYLGGLGNDNGFLHVWDGAQIANHSWVSALNTVYGEDDAHLGWSVRGLPDLNNDGRGEVLLGAPTGHPSNPDWGMAAVFSGETGSFISAVTGAQHDSFGEYVGPALDIDGDGRLEYIACGPNGDNASPNCGVLRTIGLYPVLPWAYCYSKLNSLGCAPVMSWSGAPSVSSGSFHVLATQVLNQKSGLMFYGFDDNNGLFQGGTMCVQAPLQRLPIQNSGGSATGNDCTGVFDTDFGALLQSGVHPALGVGQEVFCQTWSRDPADAFTSSFSNALRFVVGP